MDDLLFLDCRARVLADLSASSLATALAVSVLEDALESRRWWAEQWPDGMPYVAGLVAQDVQDAIVDRGTRWPVCPRCQESEHALHIHPELGGPDPVWICEELGVEIAALGALRHRSGA